MPVDNPGLFITLEGGEGVGKSTAAASLAVLLQEEGHKVTLTREPGGTAGAEAIRRLLLEQSLPLVPMAQTMLHFAARVDHVERCIRPALMRGEIVICDRFYDSTLAYQVYGQGVARADVEALIGLVRLTPDLTFLLDLPGEQALRRLAARAGGTDRYEDMGKAFFDRVRAGFEAIATAAPTRFVRVDASPSPQDVAAKLRQAISERTRW